MSFHNFVPPNKTNRNSLEITSRDVEALNPTDFDIKKISSKLAAPGTSMIAELGEEVSSTINKYSSPYSDTPIPVRRSLDAVSYHCNTDKEIVVYSKFTISLSGNCTLALNKNTIYYDGVDLDVGGGTNNNLSKEDFLLAARDNNCDAVSRKSITINGIKREAKLAGNEESVEETNHKMVIVSRNGTVYKEGDKIVSNRPAPFTVYIQTFISYDNITKHTMNQTNYYLNALTKQKIELELTGDDGVTIKAVKVMKFNNTPFVGSYNETFQVLAVEAYGSALGRAVPILPAGFGLIAAPHIAIDVKNVDFMIALLAFLKNNNIAPDLPTGLELMYLSSTYTEDKVKKILLINPVAHMYIHDSEQEIQLKNITIKYIDKKSDPSNPQTDNFNIQDKLKIVPEDNTIDYLYVDIPETNLHDGTNMIHVSGNFSYDLYLYTITDLDGIFAPSGNIVIDNKAWPDNYSKNPFGSFQEAQIMLAVVALGILGLSWAIPAIMDMAIPILTVPSGMAIASNWMLNMIMLFICFAIIYVAMGLDIKSIAEYFTNFLHRISNSELYEMFAALRRFVPGEIIEKIRNHNAAQDKRLFTSNLRKGVKQFVNFLFVEFEIFTAPISLSHPSTMSTKACDVDKLFDADTSYILTDEIKGWITDSLFRIFSVNIMSMLPTYTKPNPEFRTSTSNAFYVQEVDQAGNFINPILKDNKWLIPNELSVEDLLTNDKKTVLQTIDDYKDKIIKNGTENKVLLFYLDRLKDYIYTTGERVNKMNANALKNAKSSHNSAAKIGIAGGAIDGVPGVGVPRGGGLGFFGRDIETFKSDKVKLNSGYVNCVVDTRYRNLSIINQTEVNVGKGASL